MPVHPAPPKLSTAASIAAIVGLSLIWGYHWAVMKIGLYYCGALTYSAIRCIVAAPLMLIFVRLQGRSIKVKSPGWALLVGVVQTAGNFGIGAIAVKFGEAGRSAVLTYTMPFWLMVLSYLFLGDRAGPRRWIAAFLAMAGILVVALASGRAQLGPVLLALAAGVLWAGGVILYQRALKAHNDESTVFAAWQLLAGGIAMALAIPAFGGEGGIQWTWPFVASLTYTTLLATAVAVYLWFLLISRLEAGTAAFGVLLAPALALVSSWMQLDERPPPIEALGLLVILAAIAFFAWAEWRRAHLARRA
ncbi:MAG TPA: DMT family transporter [Dongiaceae bacterium]|jgi:drug/metabolite transporter (DMT)-like permease|nr:DMT family transporter [Dongiaceae bacterium]